MSACYFIGAPGGTSAIAGYFASLGKELARRGNEVKIITHSTEFNGNARGQNPEILLWPSPRPTRLADAIFLAQLIRRHQPDCLIANFAAVNWMSLVGWLCRVRHRIAFYHTLKTQIDRDTIRAPRGRWKLGGFRKSLVYKATTSVVGISQAALLDAQNFYGVPALKCSRWSYSMPDPAGRMAIKAASDRDDTIICAARLSESKGQDVLISALALGQGLLASINAEFLGEGQMVESLRRLAREKGVASRCHFVGRVSHEEVLARMSRAKVTVVPSRREAFGLVNIESMAVGTPLVASRVDGIPEIVRDGVDGYLVPSDDPKALAEKLGLILKDQSLRTKLGRNGRQHFLEDYEESLVVKTQVDWLEKLVKSGGQEHKP